MFLFVAQDYAKEYSRHFIQGMRRKRRGSSSTFKVDMGFSDQSLLELTVFVRESPKEKTGSEWNNDSLDFSRGSKC